MDLLDPWERARAAGFHFDKDRSRFVICHGWLRRILGEREKARPESLELLLGGHGKPFAAGHWQFNLSYGGHWVVIATAEQMPIGVDLEPFRLLPDALSMARNYFTSDENSLIERTCEPTRSRHFLTLWTRKEAYLKATGLGLTAPLNQITMGLKNSCVYDGTNQRWRLVNLPGLKSHAAALCAPGRWVWRHHPLPQL